MPLATTPELAPVPRYGNVSLQVPPGQSSQDEAGTQCDGISLLLGYRLLW